MERVVYGQLSSFSTSIIRTIPIICITFLHINFKELKDNMIKGDGIYDLFDGCYTITREGDIYSGYHEHCCFEIQKRVGADGYPCANLTVDGVRRTVAVHRLLAITFIPNPENKPQVNHKNGNKLDYSLNNLEWSTPSENMQHAMDNGLCKPPKQPCKVVDISTGREYPSIKKAAADLNISYSNCKKYLLGLVKNKTSLRYA